MSAHILSFLTYLGTPPSTLHASNFRIRHLYHRERRHDYQTDHKFTLTTFSPTGATITSSGTKKGEFLAADVNTQLKNKNITTDIKVDTSSNFFTTITADEPAPGLKTIFCFKVPDQRSGNVEVHYLHDYAAVSSSIGLTVYPTVNFSGVIGTNVASLGTDLSFDTKTGDFINACDIVFGMLIMYALDPLTTLKARLNNAAKASALVQHEWRPKSFFTFSGEVDTKAIEKIATKRPGGGH
uniref:Mitochondrial outer membrane protein porin of 34 kDa n=1 Tax=Salix viminalis TaxID=40686 RepID=A0A6N2M4D8_SALVM